MVSAQGRERTISGFSHGFSLAAATYTQFSRCTERSFSSAHTVICGRLLRAAAAVADKHQQLVSARFYMQRIATAKARKRTAHTGRFHADVTFLG